MTAVTSPSSATRAVVDASTAVRAFADRDVVAQRWLETEVAWPTLLYAEVAHALLRLHRHRGLPLARAREALDAIYAIRADARPVAMLVPDALNVALERSLTVYDACYVVLAEALEAPLVTADRRLAAATANAVLLT